MTLHESTRDPALTGILIGNALTLLIAWLLGWGLVELLWPFWFQSLVIGWYARARILKLVDFCTDGNRYNGRELPATEASKHQVANFFALHFGLFHAFYAFFLLAFTLTADPAGYIQVRHEGTGEFFAVHVGRVHLLDLLAFALVGRQFVAAHRRSHEIHVDADLAGRPNIGKLAALPYLRVVPMHLTIIFGVWLGGGVAGITAFLILKTMADVGMHRYEHRHLQSR